MYKLKKLLFGWDYIYWSNSCDNGIAKIFITKCGKIVYYRYKITKLIDVIKNPNEVIWLTCHPNKYFK